MSYSGQKWVRKQPEVTELPRLVVGVGRRVPIDS